MCVNGGVPGCVRVVNGSVCLFAVCPVVCASRIEALVNRGVSGCARVVNGSVEPLAISDCSEAVLWDKFVCAVFAVVRSVF